MRNTYILSSDCGPIVGEIIHGKKFYFENEITYRVFYGTSINPVIDINTIRNLQKSVEVADVCTSYKFEPRNSYMIIAIPAELGLFDFKIDVFTGGFEEPVTEYYGEENKAYNVYRSTRILRGDISINVVKKG